MHRLSFIVYNGEAAEKMAVHSGKKDDVFPVMAHFGASLAAPGNTWPAFEIALEMGADVNIM